VSLTYYDVSTALDLPFAGNVFTFTAADDPNTISPGDILVVAIEARHPSGGSTLTPPGDWSQDWYWSWHDATDGHDYVVGFYSKVWTVEDQATYTAAWTTEALPNASWTALHCAGAGGFVATDFGDQAAIGTEAAGSYFWLIDGQVNLELDSASGGYYSKASWARYILGDVGSFYVGAIGRASSFDDVTFFAGVGFSFDYGSTSSGFQGNVVAVGNSTKFPGESALEIRIVSNVRRVRRMSVS
jgi:hypothetical protein